MFPTWRNLPEKSCSPSIPKKNRKNEKTVKTSSNPGMDASSANTRVWVRSRHQARQAGQGLI
eukprot:1379168-Amorphochlora_amoeboformis.AAC.1